MFVSNPMDSVTVIHVVILVIDVFILGGVGAAIYAYAAARTKDATQQEEIAMNAKKAKEGVDLIMTNHLAHQTAVLEQLAKGQDKLVEIAVSQNEKLAVLVDRSARYPVV